MPACSQCKYYEEFYPASDDAQARGLCYYPAEFLPTSMAGCANRERETVEADNDKCPCYQPPMEHRNEPS